jgi:hypothetical protein
MMSYKNSFYSLFCLPSGKADDTPSPSLPRDRSKLLRLRPWTPWIWAILNIRSIRVISMVGLYSQRFEISAGHYCLQESRLNLL